jgi:hypothetical protein
MSKRELQIILKTDERSTVLELVRDGKFAENSATPAVEIDTCYQIRKRCCNGGDTVIETALRPSYCRAV